MLFQQVPSTIPRIAGATGMPFSSMQATDAEHQHHGDGEPSC